ncbi:fasciclin domain-containing protein [Mucilaginibacter sp. UR6-11]|uniref:fasciclin domain-containing protein n=1 Tax=Mucilaginibacter sp. UR6-11 TaxID=1435644 RepID=UPI001E3516AE|nr:fasciclin domain-containing protein [Mucilaginibacter sp. UR6-11]MCC8424880.1 fasciclin domain-containing protein [Mucilaginibacter sp. UR6-11]
MKRSILFGKYLVAMVIATLILQTGCKRELGDHNATPTPNTTNLTTYDYLKSKPGVYDSLLLLVDKMGIKQTLTDSTVTLFAPSNSSFQIAIKNLNDIRKSIGQGPIYLSQLAAGGVGLPTGKIRSKAKRDSAQLDTMVSRYIIRKKFVANDFAIGDGQVIYSVRGGYPMHGQRIFADAEGYQGGGSEVIEFANTKRSLFVAKWSTTTTSSVDIQTKNGIVHLLKPDHVFGFDEFVSRINLVPPPPVVFDLKNDKLYPSWPPASGYTDGQVSAGEIFIRCLDGSVLTKFITYWATQYPTTMYWLPKVPKVSNCYTMTSANDSKSYRERDPRAFRLEATLDPNPASSTAVWTLLDVRQDQDWTTNYQQKIFDFKNTVAYTGYRLTIVQIGTGSTNGNLFQISEWTMNYRDPNN